MASKDVVVPPSLLADEGALKFDAIAGTFVLNLTYPADPRLSVHHYNEFFRQIKRHVFGRSQRTVAKLKSEGRRVSDNELFKKSS